MALLLVQLLPEHAHLCAQRRVLTPQPAHLLLLLALEVELNLLEVGEDLAAAGRTSRSALSLASAAFRWDTCWVRLFTWNSTLLT